MHKQRQINGIIFSMAVLLFLVSACDERNSKNVNTPESKEVVKDPLPVSYIVLEASSFNEEIISNGKLHAYRKAALRFNAPGSIEKINYHNGAWARQGAIIARLNSDAQKIAINNAENDVANARLELSSLLLGHGGEAQDSNSVPPAIYENLKLQSGLFQANNTLESAELQYAHTMIKAPFSGIITDIEAQTHNLITGSDIFCHILDVSKFIAEFPVIENELALIKIGQKVKVIPFALEALVMEGSISEINPSVDEHGLVSVKALIPGNYEDVFDGMNVKIMIEKEIKDQLVVPREALVLRSNKEVIFTYENGLAKWNYVSIAKENSSSYLISDGLQPGDSVIIRGNLNLAHDARVRIE